MNLIQVDRNVRISVNDINPCGEKTVVFLHGWPFSSDIFEYQYTVLPRYGVRCVGIDIRGFGGSDQPWNGYNYNSLAEDLHRVICSLNLRCCTLFGFSMGGAICARYLARRGAGDRVGKLILCGAACPSFVQRPGQPIGKTVGEVDDLIRKCYYDRPCAVSEFGKTCFYSNPSQEFMGWVDSLCLEAAGYSTIKCLESLRDEDLSEDLSCITVPTAIFHGVHDQVCPFGLAELMRESIRDSYVVPFECSGHALCYDEKEKCNTCILEFIG